jgi:hypothetical protein
MDSLGAIDRDGLRTLLLEQVGAERYAAAREQAWRTAAGTGRSQGPRSIPAFAAGDEQLGAVVSELADVTWYAHDRPDPERLGLSLALYREMPSYAVLMYGTGPYREFDGETRKRFWEAYRALLADADDRLADPISYSLWCDYFEDAEIVQDAWNGINPDTLAPRGLRRLLEVAGPVPWARKAPV